MRTLLLICIAALLGSMVGCRPSGMAGHGSGSGSGSNVANVSAKGILDFYAGTGVTQYFLKPVRLDGEAHRYAMLDITSRDTADKALYRRMMISFIGPDAVAASDTLLLGTDAGMVLPPSGFKVLYVERPGKGKQLTRLEVMLPQVLAYNVCAKQRPCLALAPAGKGRAYYQSTKKAASRMAAFSQIALSTAKR